MTVLICGSREWTDEDAIRHEILKFNQDTLVVHGAARGADRIAGAHAEALGYPVKAFPAQWDRYGKSAGPFRNQEMLNFLLLQRTNGEIVKVIAFTPDLDTSKGTGHMVRIARAAGIDVEVFNT